MAATKPTSVPYWATDNLNVTEPNAAMKALGSAYGTTANSSWDNWLKKTTGEWIEWISERFDDKFFTGTPVSDSLAIKCPGDDTLAISINPSEGLNIPKPLFVDLVNWTNDASPALKLRRDKELGRVAPALEVIADVDGQTTPVSFWGSQGILVTAHGNGIDVSSNTTGIKIVQSLTGVDISSGGVGVKIDSGTDGLDIDAEGNGIMVASTAVGGWGVYASSGSGSSAVGLYGNSADGYGVYASSNLGHALRAVSNGNPAGAGGTTPVLIDPQSSMPNSGNRPNGSLQVFDGSGDDYGKIIYFMDDSAKKVVTEDNPKAAQAYGKINTNGAGSVSFDVLGDYNIASVSLPGGTNRIRVTFTNAMPNDKYVPVLTTHNVSGGFACTMSITTTYFEFEVFDQASGMQSPASTSLEVRFSVFGGIAS
jgi:hypothetical protein